MRAMLDASHIALDWSLAKEAEASPPAMIVDAKFKVVGPRKPISPEAALMWVGLLLAFVLGAVVPLIARGLAG